MARFRYHCLRWPTRQWMVMLFLWGAVVFLGAGTYAHAAPTLTMAEQPWSAMPFGKDDQAGMGLRRGSLMHGLTSIRVAADSSIAPGRARGAELATGTDSTLLWWNVGAFVLLAIIISLLVVNTIYRRRVERALRASEERLRAITDHSPAAISLKTKDGRFLSVNKQFASMLGVTPERVKGKTSHHLFPKRTADESVAHDQEVLELGKATEREQLVVLDDGIHTFLTVKFPVTDTQGRISAIAAIATDITERKRAERTLRWYAHIVSFADEYLAFVDRYYIFRAVNQRYVDGYKKPTEEIVGHTLEELMGQDIFEALVKPNIDRCLGGEGVNVECWMEVPAYGRRYMDIRYTPYMARDSGVTGVVISSRDITARRRTEEVYQQHRMLLRNVIDTDPNLIFVKDTKGRYSLVNKAMADFYQSTVKELIGKTDGDINKDTDAFEHFSEGDNEVLEAMKQMVILEDKLTDRGGSTRWFQTVKRPLVGSDGRTDQMLGIAVDITQRREAEDALRESEGRFKDFAETAADWFWEIGPDFKFTYIAGRYEEVTGMTADEMIGHSHRELFKTHVSDPTRLEQYHEALEAQQPFAPIEYEWIRPDGTTRMIRSSCKPVFDNDGAFCGYRGTARDVTDAYRLSRQLSYQASHDMLTGLVNRRDFERRLERVLETARTEGAEHALCYLDLDQFKVINDTCGHVAGDELLRQLGKLLPDRVRKRDTLARLGGDEFGVLMERCSLGHAMRVANDLRQAIQEYRFIWEGKHFNIGVSIGLVPITSASTSITEVLREADAACYAAKREGRNRVHVYRKGDPKLTQHHGEMQWVLRLNQALETNGFCLSRQPIVPVDQRAGERDRYELLLRLRTTAGERLPPGAFLPAAERYDLAPRLDRWVIRTALSWLAANPPELEQLQLCSINLSGQSIADEEFLQYVTRQIDLNQIPPEKLCFEVTETTAIANLATVTGFMRELKDRGCQFALDDFGSGLSSFAYLRSLPVDYLKIDGSFVEKIGNDQIALAIVRSINDIGKVMGKKTIAAHVESDQILGTLKAIGVDYVQGYLVGEPEELQTVEPVPEAALLLDSLSRGGSAKTQEGVQGEDQSDPALLKDVRNAGSQGT